jgi:hypothetical protein
LSRSAPQKRTFVLASQYPVSTARLQAALGRAVRRRKDRIEDYRMSRRDGPVQPESGAARTQSWGTDVFQKAFVELFSVYRSYWGDDPDFDFTNTQEVLPDLPCPELTDEMLEVLTQYSLEVNFGFPRPRYNPPAFSARDWIRRSGKAFEGNGAAVRPGGAGSSLFGITITGPGGGCWTICDNGYGPFSYIEGQEDVASVARMTSSTFRDLVCGDTSVEEAVARARIVLYGKQDDVGRLRSILQAKAKGFRPSAARGDSR